MTPVTDVAALEALYPPANPASLDKVADHLTPLYRDWIGASRFAILSTVGPEGTDASPRGEDGPVARIEDARTLALPDWRGNNRLDSLRNILRDGRASLMFLVPGSQNVVRVNGRAVVTADAAVCASFERDGKRPATVIVFTVGEVYFQCAKAVMRSALWTSGDRSGDLPSAGDFLREAKDGFDAERYDRDYPSHARETLW
ncbi:pyridoxamine 5'-phosphate oxidase family protein [Litorisediminicola beolgyonensis]|uniref:Pyridoxamine 5'-phosphate oxidase family protein n=1 Tax=Litorisediminicola beolgyonensis TaxID=1173614 RepID=A0ABW3ZN78_9RHOB